MASLAVCDHPIALAARGFGAMRHGSGSGGRRHCSFRRHLYHQADEDPRLERSTERGTMTGLPERRLPLHLSRRVTPPGARIRVRIGRMDSRLRGNDGKEAVDVIPAKAGIHGFSDQRSSKTRKPNTDAGARASRPPGPEARNGRPAARPQLSKRAGPRSRSQEPRSRSQEPRSRSQEPRSRSQEPRSRSQEPRSAPRNPARAPRNPAGAPRNPAGASAHASSVRGGDSPDTKGGCWPWRSPCRPLLVRAARRRRWRHR